MKTNKIVVAALVLCASFHAVAAGKTYTPAQLKQMVNAGNFPDQEQPVESTKYVPFERCKTTVRAITGDIQPNYPVRTILDVPSMLSMKAWTNDAAIVMSCSQDGKLVMQQSKYR